MAFAWISSKTFTFCSFSALSSSSSSSSGSNYYRLKLSKFHFRPSIRGVNCSCKYGLPAADELKFVLHDALEFSGLTTTHARAARVGFCSQIENLSEIERDTSISVNRGVDLGRTALYIAAEDDSLISHSSVPLPVDDFIERLDSLSMGYCSCYSSSFRSSPENFLDCLERYLYVNKGFRRTNAGNQVEQHALYLNSVLTHRSGSVSMLSFIYSEILKMLRMWGVLNFDVEIFFPHDSHSCPRGYQKQKSKESDQLHIMTAQSLLVELLKDLKNAFWPFQLDHARSPFLRAAQAAQGFTGFNVTKESALELASAKAARHRLQRGVWTSVRFGDMRRALSACERLILLKTDPKELRDYAVLLYHCGFYEESLQFLKLYQDTKQPYSTNDLEEDAVEKLIVRLNLILMEEGWSRQPDHKGMLFNNSEPW
ncbi:hypothetical protein CDL12_28184 [Handroanthus impetiginosus]|uniref:Protein SirB1 N-terminal domain-containing protein n=1 Tax=Handroanthus impetiginosus TaxID=429701 RepID=A0A2G9G1X7_9LAMI|nr:hypothetical protein CDL12_28184 [Handroanthus impetiginosus]